MELSNLFDLSVCPRARTASWAVVLLAVVSTTGTAVAQTTGEDEHTAASESSETRRGEEDSEAADTDKEGDADESDEDADELQASGDRPGFSTGTGIVPKGHVQLEGGTELSGSQTLDWTGLMLLGRFGFTDWFEFRLDTSAFQVSDLGGDTSHKLLDQTSISAKFGARINEHLRLGVLPFVSLQNLSNTTSPGVSAGLHGLVDLESGGPVSLTLNVGSANVEASDGRGFESWISSSVNIDLPASLGTYAEFYMVAPPESDPAVFGDTGITFHPVDVLQLDAYGGLELGDRDAWYVGLGATWLL